MKRHLLYGLTIGALSLFISACQSTSSNETGTITIPVNKNLVQTAQISLKDDVVKIEYIPLETNDSCLISNVLSLQVSKEYLFLYNGKTNQVLQFDRTGKYITTIGRTGNGPGEYGLVSDLAIDENNRQLYIFQLGKAPVVYSFDNKFLFADTTLQMVSNMALLRNKRRALKGQILVPNAWLAAIQNEEGVIVDEVYPYPSTLPKEVCYMGNVIFSSSGNNALAFTTCNDTVFRLTDKGIIPAYYLERENRKEFYSDVADIRQRKNTPIQDADIDLYDLFETPNYLYLRVSKAGKIYIQRYSKSGHLGLSCQVPDDYLACSFGIPGNNVIGITNDVDNGVPFWPEFSINENMRAQMLTYDLISGLQEKGYLEDMPEVLRAVKEDDNPIVILYTFKSAK